MQPWEHVSVRLEVKSSGNAAPRGGCFGCEVIRGQSNM